MSTSDDTALVILPLPDVPGSQGVVFPPASAMGITHSLGMVDGTELYRDTLNVLRAAERWRKYTLTLSASDISPPALGGVWRGMPLRVHCALQLYTSGSPERPVVPGSLGTEPLDGGGTVTVYRPILDMRVVGWSSSFAEWAAGTDWSLDLEEI